MLNVLFAIYAEGFLCTDDINCQCGKTLPYIAIRILNPIFSSQVTGIQNDLWSPSKEFRQIQTKIDALPSIITRKQNKNSFGLAASGPAALTEKLCGVLEGVTSKYSAFILNHLGNSSHKFWLIHPFPELLKQIVKNCHQQSPEQFSTYYTILRSLLHK